MANSDDGPYLIETAAEREARERREEQSRDRRQRKLQLWFNGLLLLATVVTVGVVLYQNRILSRTLSEMVTQTTEIKRSTNASVDAADAAQIAARATENQLPLQLGQLDVARQQAREASVIAAEQLSVQTKVATDQINQARQALREDQRAWLTYTNYRIRSREAPPKGVVWSFREPNWGDEFSVRIGVANTGRTPAVRVTHNAAIFVGATAPANWPNWDSMQWMTPTILFPNDDGRYLESQPRTFKAESDTSAYRSGKTAIWVMVRTYYCDVYGRRHWTDVCASHRFTVDLSSETGVFSFCGAATDNDSEPSHSYCR